MCKKVLKTVSCSNKDADFYPNTCEVKEAENG